MTDEGRGVLLEGPWTQVVSASATAALGVAALAAGFGGWLWKRASPWERALFVLSGLLLLHAGGWSDAVGLAVGGVVGILHYLRHSGQRGER